MSHWEVPWKMRVCVCVWPSWPNQTDINLKKGMMLVLTEWLNLVLQERQPVSNKTTCKSIRNMCAFSWQWQSFWTNANYNIYIYTLSIYIYIHIYIYIYVHTINIIHTAYSTMCSFRHRWGPFSKSAVAHPPSLSATPQTPFGRIGASHAQPPWRIPW